MMIFLIWCSILADLSLFSTKTLVETNGDHQVEVRTQVKLRFNVHVVCIISKVGVSRFLTSCVMR